MKINYFVLGTNNMDAAIQFYDALFADTGINRTLQTGRMTYWQSEDFAFALAIPFDQQAATHGNGTMLGFNVESVEEVNRLHEKALGLGGSCEGEPNQRGPMYSAYVRDLDGNKLNFYK